MPLKHLAAFCAGVLFAVPALADGDFSACINNLQQQARAQGLSEHVVNDVLGKVAYTQRVIDLDRRQPEFTLTFANYLNQRVTPERVAQGRALYAQHRELLRKITEEYGVPGRYLVAFWGMETNFGRFFGKMSTLDSLATLACDRRRGEYFTDQLMDALRIVDRGDVTADGMKGSWAGALGNFQFMPSVFLQYAVDYDGDGRRDVWGSLPDAMASAANFLRGLGWKTGTRWGREVKLPEGFSYRLAGLDGLRPLDAWRKLGVTEADGQPLPQEDVKASLLIPAGHNGPAFLVYPNFQVIMGWNRSEFYALSVGYLADRIAGAGKLRNPPPTDLPNLDRETVRALQQELNAKGLDAGEADGILGPATRSAVRAFQERQGLVADGYPSRKVLDLLGVSPR